MERLIENRLPIFEISKLALKEGNSKKPVYQLHKWWARRQGSVVRALLVAYSLPKNATEEDFWNAYYSKNDLSDKLVLDPFLGGGSTLVESNKMNARTIGVDVDPMPIFITKKELQELNFDLDLELNKIYEKVKPYIAHLYKTKVNGKEQDVVNVFWLYEYECKVCSHKVTVEPHYHITHNKKEKIVYCMECREIHTIGSSTTEYTCLKCKHTNYLESKSYSRGVCMCKNCGSKSNLRDMMKNGSVQKQMLALEYFIEKERFFKKPDKEDIGKYESISFELLDQVKQYIPRTAIPNENRSDQRPLTHGFYFYKDLFNNRQLYCLGIILREILKINNKELREWFLIAFSDSLASNNMLCNYAYGYSKLTPLFGIHAYTIPARPVENNVWGTTFGRGSFIKNISKVIKAKLYCDKPYEAKYINNKLIKTFTQETISSSITRNSNEFFNGEYGTLLLNKSSEQLNEIPSKTIDFILTDPPYYDNLNYSELADFYYQWIKDYLDKELPHNPLLDSLQKGKDYDMSLVNVFKECYRVLKDDGIMAFSYHHNKQEAWDFMEFAIKTSGFKVTNILPIRSEGNSAYHSDENSIKWDSIIVMRKSDFYKKNCKNTFVNIERLVKMWRKEFEVYSKEDEKMLLKECDRISFFRSLKMAYNINKEDSSN